jgi:uracil-DNA glycosylase
VLDKLYEAYQKDPNFHHLRDTANFVPGKGPVPAPLMLAGEAPANLENAKREPFVGQSGVVLDKLLMEVGLDISRIFYTNAVKYWPRDENGKTRKPSYEEVEDSTYYLKREIEIVNPAIVALCGATAAKAFFPVRESMIKLNGRLLDGKFVVVFHPAVMLYKPEMSPIVRAGYASLKAHTNGMLNNE